MSSDRKPLHHFWAPKYWPGWLGLAVLRLICLLPRPVSMGIGQFIGRVAHRTGKKRRAIALRNIELCFPDLTTEEQRALARQHFEALGMSMIELGLGRWASDEKLAAMTTIEGVEHLQAGIDAGKGIILLGAHFTTLEISGRVLRRFCPSFDVVYRPHRSAFLTEILRSGRERSADSIIEKGDIRAMVRSLRQGRPVWYAPDQSYSRKGAELIPFFGVPSMHNTATTTLARLGKAITLPYFPRRLPDGRYEIRILAPLVDVPSDDAIADTKKYVAALEDHIRLCPEQYFWIHRKFKGLPAGYPDYYADLDASK